MSDILSVELVATCNALGRYDPKNQVYFHEDDILETVKDIIRYLRRDTDSHEIRRYYGEAKILQINLLPLLKLYWKQTELFDVLLRLLGNLTSPVFLLYNEEVPKEKETRNHFLQILGHLQSYKEAFGDEEVWTKLCTRLTQLLEIDPQERSEESGLIIERILILVRNVLSIPPDVDSEKRADNDVNAHDKVIWSLRQSGIFDIIHYMVSSDQEEFYYMYLLEILSVMLRDYRPVDLARVFSAGAESEKTQDSKEFDSIRSREFSRRKERMKAYTSARHSRFGGTYLINNIDSVKDNQGLIYHKKLNTTKSINFDADKKLKKTPKNRRAYQETDTYRRSTISIRLLLCDFCIEFLNSGYNRLMHYVRGKLVRGKSATQDESYYLWAVRYFMEFNRHYNFEVKLISETMSTHIFHYIQQLMEKYYEMINSDKKMWNLWSKRLHFAVLAYKELLLTLNEMSKSSNEDIKQSAKVIKSNLFYIVEYREFILLLLLSYNPKTMSNLYLLDLMEMQHIFLKMLQQFCGKDNIVVQEKQKVGKKKKKKRQETRPAISAEESLEAKWDELGPQVSVILEGGQNIPIVVPFDAASEVPISEQRKDAMIRIQDFLRDNDIENAIGLLRAARDVWPDNDCFGNNNMSLEEEFLAIREIFLTKLRDSEEIPATNEDTNEDNEEESEEDELDGVNEIEREVDFKFDDFIKRFAHPNIIKACGLALKNFDTNSTFVNHCIIKLMHRVAWDCKMPAMLFQLSLFKTFQRIFAEDTVPEYKELVKFAIFIIRKFVIVSKKNQFIGMELLFWKNSKEAYDLEEGYGSYDRSNKTKKSFWTEEEEEELRTLFAEYQENNIQQDIIDWILNNLVDNTKTRRMVIKKLKLLNLFNYKGPIKRAVSVPQIWEEEEISQLRELYNNFQHASDPLKCIADRLDVKRSKNQIKKKLLELEIAPNAKALWKKRAKKNQELDGNNSDDSVINSDSSSGNSSNDEENEVHANRSVTKATPKRKSINKPKTKAHKTNELNISAIKKIIIEVINNDMTSSLKWVAECLEETAEDLKDENSTDENEGIPLVPICEADLKAMKHLVFQKFLLNIGISKPSTEQEIYWRISGTAKYTELMKLSELINEVINNPVLEPEQEVADAQNASSDDEYVFTHLRNESASNTQNTHHQQAEVEDESAFPSTSTSEQSNELAEKNTHDNSNDNKLTNSKKKNTKQIIFDDSHSESDSENCATDNNLENINKTTDISVNNTKNVKKRIINESSDSDSDKENETVLSNTNDDINNENINRSTDKKTKRIIINEDSDSESEKQNRNADINSENEENSGKRTRTYDLDSPNQVKKKKKVAILDSDEDE